MTGWCSDGAHRLHRHVPDCAPVPDVRTLDSLVPVWAEHDHGSPLRRRHAAVVPRNEAGAEGERGVIENLLRRIFRHQDIEHAGSLYLRRFLLTPSVFGWRLMLHKICRPDNERVLHDHPWDFAVLCVRGGYIEAVLHPGGVVRESLVSGQVRFRSFIHTHRIDRILGPVAWTLVLHGPRVHRWGFWDTDARPPYFTEATEYFKAGYDKASTPRHGVEVARPAPVRDGEAGE